ncbi:MAG: thermonuclease family protein [Gemmatimonadota bacterium]|nr:thermonuclease family protein [Gemmatimonadota bacterium]MDH4351479.1 thermonuclease family protein [Gemmatimonadota bacterium]MDH5197299.1 thermonuclease family protein [Gemmatimonadota bacterium]
MVARIVDGDTIICAPNQRVRLIGMDTPEMRHVPFGRQARDTLAMLVPAGARVQLEPDVERTDRYGRALAYVWRDGMLINWWLVRSGWARTLTVPPNVRYVDQFREAQRAARAEGRGLWDHGTFACGPGAQAGRGC